VKKKYDSKDILKILGISRKTLYNWIKSGVIPEPKRFPPKTGDRFWYKQDVEKLKKLISRD